MFLSDCYQRSAKHLNKWHGQTILLVVVKTVATYWLATAKRGGQMFTDSNGRWQIAMQDLALSIKEEVEGIFE